MASASETILLPGSGKSPLSSAARAICLVCQKQFSQYTCPRCNIRYCSVNCYKKHNLRCTESFMRDNVMDEMKQMHHDDETKKKTMEMLKRVYMEEETNGEEVEDSFLSQETIDKVLSGDDLSLEDLSPEERKHFQRAISSGILSRMIEPWHPWWLNPSARSITLGHDGTQMVRPVDDVNQLIEMESSLTQIPLGPETLLPSLSRLTSRSPSPLLPVHFLEVIYSYCFTLRLYNGDWRDDPLSAAAAAMTMSPVLVGDREREPAAALAGEREIWAVAVTAVLGQCLERTCSPEFKHAGGTSLGWILVKDVVSLLFLGKDALICSLCDLRRLVQAAEEILRSEKLKRERKFETRRKLERVEKKLFFFMCWVNEQRDGEFWSSMASQVQAEMASLAVVEIPNAKMEPRRKPVIEEV